VGLLKLFTSCSHARREECRRRVAAASKGAGLETFVPFATRHVRVRFEPVRSAPMQTLERAAMNRTTLILGFGALVLFMEDHTLKTIGKVSNFSRVVRGSNAPQQHESCVVGSVSNGRQSRSIERPHTRVCPLIHHMVAASLGSCFGATRYDGVTCFPPLRPRAPGAGSFRLVLPPIFVLYARSQQDGRQVAAIHRLGGAGQRHARHAAGNRQYAADLRADRGVLRGTEQLRDGRQAEAHARNSTGDKLCSACLTPANAVQGLSWLE
jgi:hypothetical protein